jgi:peptidoglycan/LPS O-acetylase OafA/YrhL
VSSARPSAIPHLPALDGLRGVALLGVLFFHSNERLPGGYLGVDLFFVLSGYLITSLLLAEHRDTGRIALAAFWVRRARRLFPALLALLAGVAIYARFFAKPDELARIRGDALATLGYVANWRAIFSQKSYWEMFATPSPLEHTWSLSIEEQFYVAWPLLVMALLRRTGARGPRVVLGVTLALALLSALAMLLLFDPAKPSRVYLGTDTRAAGLLVGAAFACLLPPTTRIGARVARIADALGVLAILGLGVAWCTLEGKNPFLYRGGLWLTELGALALIACAVAGKQSLVARLLSLPPLTWVGVISYGLYLWHWPVNVFISPERFRLGAAAPPIQFAVTFAIAIVSYRFLERPIRRRGLPFGRPAFVVPAAIAATLLLVISATHGAASRARGPSSMFGESQLVEPTSAPLFTVLMVGDSTASSLGWALRTVHRRGVAVELMGYDGCTMLQDSCGGDRWAGRTSTLRPHATLFFVGGAFMHGIHAADGSWVEACHPEWDARFQAVLTKRLPDLVAPQTRVFAVTLPYPSPDSAWGSDAFRGQVDCINASIRRAAAEVPSVEILDLASRLCPGGVCERESNATTIRVDGVHYDTVGARVLSDWILEQLLSDAPADVQP